jgi:RNA polymerase sigma-70 factor (ECF subfamily)
VLVLRDVEGLTAPEVAIVLGVGVDAVKSRLHRARVFVRDRITPLLAAPAEPSVAAGCPDVVAILSQYLEGEIGPEQCAEMDRHVAQCPRCQAGTVPPDIQEVVRRALREAAGQAQP